MSLPMVIAALGLICSCWAKCPNNCSGHGLCDKYSRCTCGDGFQAADCSERTCPYASAWSDQAIATDSAHAPAECSNRGHCDRTSGRCKCLDGFIGTACERLSCANDCSGAGVCMSMGKRAADTRDDYSRKFTYSTAWDSTKLQGCVCDAGRSGFDCSERECPIGDDPLTVDQTDEVQLVQCLATAGAFALQFRGVPTRWIPHSASAADVARILALHPLLGEVEVAFSSSASSVCGAAGPVASIVFSTPGPQPPLVPVMDDTMISAGGSSVTVSADGHLPLADADGRVFVSEKGTKEAALCSNRGKCDRTTGQCSCFVEHGDVYDSSDGGGNAGGRGDCGWVRSSAGGAVSSCPGELPCSGRGLCNGTAQLALGMIGDYTCACSSGSSAGDCSERVCPAGPSWFDYPANNDEAHQSIAPCSDMGLCDRATGSCACRPMFFGAACEYMSCPEGSIGVCSGHGKCLSMAQLAQTAQVNGEAAGFTYGSDPNNALTWDADRVMGCLCDAGFGSFDCSRELCPSGDDPNTYDDVSEVQLVVCNATGGLLTLRFRDAVSQPIPANATAAQLKRILSELPTLQQATLSVYFSSEGAIPPSVFSSANTPHLPSVISPTQSPTMQSTNSSLCSAIGQVVVIQFNGVSGSLPPLRPDTSYLVDSINGNGDFGTGSVNVYRGGATFGGYTSISGTTENDVCNNRGRCGDDGRCKCFKDWGSSDGNGNLGGRADCGYRRDDANPREYLT